MEYQRSGSWVAVGVSVRVGMRVDVAVGEGAGVRVAVGENVGVEVSVGSGVAVHEAAIAVPAVAVIAALCTGEDQQDAIPNDIRAITCSRWSLGLSIQEL